MINMRIDIIRKELERRFQEVEQLQEATNDQIEEACNRFIHFLLIEPFIKPFILELSNFKERFIQSNPFKQIRNKIVEAVKVIMTEIDSAGLIDHDFKDNLQKLPDIMFIHAFESTRSRPNPDKYIEELRRIEQYPDQKIVDGVKIILDKFNNIFNIADKLSKQYNRSEIYKYIQSLVECNEKYNAYVRTEASYDGAESLNNLLESYLAPPSRYPILSGVSSDDFGEGVKIALRGVNIFGTSTDPETIDHCRDVYHAVDKFLSTSKSKHALIARLVTYCKWIKRDEFEKIKSEKEISKIVEEFIFNQGYFPIVRFKMGKSEPDILAISSFGARWDNSILFELKQSIVTSYTDRKLADDITQAKQYLSKVGRAIQDIVDSVYLLVFYGGDYRLEVDKSYRDKCEKDNVHIELIYVGKHSPSKLTKTKILKAPKTMAKKKSPNRKAAQKATRKK